MLGFLDEVSISENDGAIDGKVLGDFDGWIKGISVGEAEDAIDGEVLGASDG